MQLQIVRAAGEDDGQPGWRMALSALSLVYRGWRVSPSCSRPLALPSACSVWTRPSHEHSLTVQLPSSPFSYFQDTAQAKLFEEINTTRFDLAGLLRVHPRIGRFVQSVDCANKDASALVVLGQLSLLPSLQIVIDLTWPFAGDQQIQPPSLPDDRPSLRQLALSVIATHATGAGAVAPPLPALSRFLDHGLCAFSRLGSAPARSSAWSTSKSAPSSSPSSGSSRTTRWTTRQSRTSSSASPTSRT